MKNIFVIICVSIFLFGCVSTKKPNEYIQNSIVKVEVDKRILQDCEQLTYPTTEEVSFEDVLVITSSNTLKYKECSARHKDAVKLIQKLTNKEE